MQTDLDNVIATSEAVTTPPRHGCQDALPALHALAFGPAAPMQCTHKLQLHAFTCSAAIAASVDWQQIVPAAAAAQARYMSCCIEGCSLAAETGQPLLHEANVFHLFAVAKAGSSAVAKTLPHEVGAVATAAALCTLKLRVCTCLRVVCRYRLRARRSSCCCGRTRRSRNLTSESCDASTD